MELHKNLTLDPTSNPTAPPTALPTNPMAIPLNQLVKPHQLALGGAAGQVASATAAAALFDLNNYASRPKLTTKLREHAAAGTGLENGSKTKADRKYAPY